MKNELLLIASIVIIYGAVLAAYRLFGKSGLFAMTAISTILANIEVLMLIDAFGMEQTLGNVMFASTYLITDILSENESKQDATKAVWIGVMTSVFMLVFTQYWLLYDKSPADWAGVHIDAIFSTTPRMLLASFLGYIISQRFDVQLYHFWWELTTRKTGDSNGYLWLRNNGSTLISQMVNTVIFTLAAFGGWYDTKTTVAIMISSYVIYIVTSLADTPVVYLARYMKRHNWVRE